MGNIKKKKLSDSEHKLLKSIIRGLQEKKAEDILLMDLRVSKNAITDYFVICSGNSKIHVEALAQSVEEFTEKEVNERPWHIEGYTNAQWVLLDYVNIVVHIFQPDIRAFYNLEGLWADAEFQNINEPY